MPDVEGPLSKSLKVALGAGSKRLSSLQIHRRKAVSEVSLPESGQSALSVQRALRSHWQEMEAAGRPDGHETKKLPFGDPESRFSPERRVSNLVRPFAALNGTTAPGQLRTAA